MPEEKKIRTIIPEISPQPSVPEVKKEQEKREEEPTEVLAITEEKAEQANIAPASVSAKITSLTSPLVQGSAKSEELIAIEKILEEGLSETYLSLSPRDQARFRERGEKTAKKIERMLVALHLNVLKVLKLIKKWLSVIPHVNAFFLEQESKIKTDKIVALYNERKKRS